MSASKNTFIEEREKDKSAYSHGARPSEFLKKHPLELAVYECELDEVRAILKELNESHILEHTEERDTVMFNEQRYIFYVLCPTTSFAFAFLHLGIKMAKVYKEREERIKRIEQFANHGE